MCRTCVYIKHVTICFHVNQLAIFSLSPDCSGVIVSLSEPTNTGNTGSFPIALSNSPHSIPLVLDNSYTISCGGGVWQYWNGTDVSTDSLDPDVSGVFVEEDGDDMDLRLQRLSEAETGEYVCMDVQDGEEFVVNISTG